jgi:hypothetical protein
MKKYFDGKLNEDDLCELKIFITAEKDAVVINFEQPIIWFALSSDEAYDLAFAIIKQAKSIDLTKPVEITS